MDFPQPLSGGIGWNAGGMLEECWESAGNGGIATQEILKKIKKRVTAQEKIN